MHRAQEYESSTESSKVVKFFILLLLLYSCFYKVFFADIPRKLEIKTRNVLNCLYM